MAIAPGKGGKCFPRSVEVARQLATRAAVAGGAISYTISHTISHTISRISRISPAREIGRDVEANRRREVQRRCEARNVEVKRLRRGERGRERAARLLVPKVAGELRRWHEVGARQHNACLAMRGGSRVRVRQRKGRAPARMNAGPRPIAHGRRAIAPVRVGVGLAARGDNQRVEGPRRRRGAGRGERVRVVVGVRGRLGLQRESL